MLANNKIFRLLLILICVFAISVRIYWASQQNELDQDEYYTILAANNRTNILGNNFKDFISDFSNISGKELYKIIFFGDKSVKDCLDDIVDLYKNSKDPYISNLYYSLFRLSFIGREVIDKKNIIITGTVLNCLLFIISFIFIYKLLKYVFEDNREIILGSIFCISLMPSSITFAMFLRAYQIQETFFIIITYIVLSTISENKYSIKNFILTTIITGICYITQFSSLLFVLILSAMLFYNFLISNKEKFHLNNLLNFSISNKIKNILIKVWFALIIIFVVSISILFILGIQYRKSDLNIINENNFGDYKHIYARINFKNQLFRANDLYQIKNVNINGDKVLDYNFHSLGYVNLKVKNDAPNNFSVSYNLKINNKIYELPIILCILIFLILFYKIGSNNLEIKNYKIILYYAVIFLLALFISQLLCLNFFNSMFNANSRAGRSLNYNSDVIGYINRISFNGLFIFFIISSLLYLYFKRNDLNIIIDKKKFNILLFVSILGSFFAFFGNMLAPFRYARYSAVSYILIFLFVPLFLSIIENKKIRIFILAILCIIYLYNITNPKRFDFFEVNNTEKYFDENLNVYLYKEIFYAYNLYYLNQNLNYTIIDNQNSFENKLEIDNYDKFYLIYPFYSDEYSNYKEEINSILSNKYNIFDINEMNGNIILKIEKIK